MTLGFQQVAIDNYPLCDQFYKVEWLRRRNVREQYGDASPLATALSTPRGWDPTYPAECELPTEGELVEMMTKRQEDWDKLKALVKQDKLAAVSWKVGDVTYDIDGLVYAMAKLACFEYHYVREGKVRAPICIGVTGNRRGSQLLDAMARQLIMYRREMKDEGIQPQDCNAITTHISVTLPRTADRRYPSDAARMGAQIYENDSKTLGFKQMTDLENYKIVYKLVKFSGYTQNDVRKIWQKDGTKGVRLFGIARVAVYSEQEAMNITDRAERKAWESIRFNERLTAPKFLTPKDEEESRVNANYLPIEKFDQKSFQGDNAERLPMMLMCETPEKFEKGRPEYERKSQKILVRPTPEMMMEWISDNVGGEKKKQGSLMQRAAIKQIAATGTNNPFARDMAKAVDQNDRTLLKRGQDRVLACIYLHETTDEIYEVLQECTQGLRDLDGDTQIELLEQFKIMVEERITQVEQAANAESEDDSDEMADQTDLDPLGMHAEPTVTVADGQLTDEEADADQEAVSNETESKDPVQETENPTEVA